MISLDNYAKLNHELTGAKETIVVLERLIEQEKARAETAEAEKAALLAKIELLSGNNTRATGLCHAKTEEIAQLRDALAEAQAEKETAEKTVAEMRAALEVMLASAHPHPVENKGMFAAWKAGEAALRQSADIAAKWVSVGDVERLRKDLERANRGWNEALDNTGNPLADDLLRRLIKRVMDDADMSLPDATDVELSLARIISQRDALAAELETTKEAVRLSEALRLQDVEVSQTLSADLLRERDRLTAELATLRSRCEGLVGGGIGLIAAERERQMSQEGWTPEHDSAHKLGQMAGAAACYALHACGFSNPHILEACRPPVTHEVRVWPWADSYWKPSDPLRDLTKAGALIAAEIDRLQRAALTEKGAN